MKYGYHATEEAHLEGIREHGLLPSKQRDPQHVYFADEQWRVMRWGPRVIRFPWPAETYPNEFFGDEDFEPTYFKDGVAYHCHEFTTPAPITEGLEVLDPATGLWRSLRGSADSRRIGG